MAIAYTRTSVSWKTRKLLARNGTAIATTIPTSRMARPSVSAGRARAVVARVSAASISDPLHMNAAEEAAGPHHEHRHDDHERDRQLQLAADVRNVGGNEV